MIKIELIWLATKPIDMRVGKRAAAIMSLIHSARLNGHDPYVYMKDVLEKLPLQPFSRISELLPHRWVSEP